MIEVISEAAKLTNYSVFYSFNHCLFLLIMYVQLVRQFHTHAFRVYMRIGRAKANKNIVLTFSHIHLHISRFEAVRWFKCQLT